MHRERAEAVMSDDTVEDDNVVDFNKEKEKLVADAMKHANGKGKKKDKEPTQGQTLLQLAQAAELFHSADGVGYADLMINGHRETWPIRSKGFKRWRLRAHSLNLRAAPRAR